jgi:hypothetical protein
MNKVFRCVAEVLPRKLHELQLRGATNVRSAPVDGAIEVHFTVPADESPEQVRAARRAAREAERRS